MILHAESEELQGRDRERWHGLWKRLGGTGNPDLPFAQIVDAYAAPGRAYHTLTHVRDSLDLFDQYGHMALQPDVVEAALWIHDVFYLPGAADNEERSASWGEYLLVRGGISTELAASVRRLVLETRHTGHARDMDSALVEDVDLAILGRGAPQYEAYEALIRWEHRDMGEKTFRDCRLKILGALLGRKSIYFTLEFREMFEQNARTNLEQSAVRLRRLH